MNRMLGRQEAEHYALRDEVVERLDALAAEAPLQENTEVTGLAPGLVLQTSDGEIRARAAVVATGDQNVPTMPTVARNLSDGVAQLHTADYRGPGQLPEGAVLVVGSAQSGCQIAEDLRGAGRRVVLSTSAVGRVPARYRGRETLAWLAEVGFFDQRPGDLPDPAMMREAQPIIAAGGRSLSLQSLARAGVTLAGRVVQIDGDRVIFDTTTPRNVATGDSFAARIRGMVDDVIARGGVDAPPAERDETDAPAELDPPVEIDLKADGISSIVWCTGFTGDFSWLDPGLPDAEGQPARQDAASVAPGLWYVGLLWLTCRGSGILRGFPGDAATVAEAVRAHLR
jgi:putative flavoprotein involved in K+ transport